jgi:hypothetical protein
MEWILSRCLSIPLQKRMIDIRVQQLLLFLWLLDLDQALQGVEVLLKSSVVEIILREEVDLQRRLVPNPLVVEEEAWNTSVSLFQSMDLRTTTIEDR